MAIQSISGEGIYFPSQYLTTVAAAGSASVGPVDATGEKISFLGPIWWPDSATSKTISGVGFRFATVVKAGGSGLTVSLQDVDTVNGLPYRPDGTPDQTAAIANGNANFASDTWIDVTLGSTRTVNKGDMIAFVIEFDGSGRLGSDAFNLATMATQGTGPFGRQGSVLFTASWAAQSQAPNVIFNFNDGTYGKILGSIVNNTPATANYSYANSSTPDEMGMKFQLPFSCQASGVSLYGFVGNANADFDIVLYDSSSTALRTLSIDATQMNQGFATRILYATMSPITLQANQDYRLIMKPTTANSVGFIYMAVNTADHFSLWPGGTSFMLTQRTDAGAWTDTSTQRPYYFSLLISGIDTGGAGGSFPFVS